MVAPIRENRGGGPVGKRQPEYIRHPSADGGGEPVDPSPAVRMGKTRERFVRDVWNGRLNDLWRSDSCPPVDRVVELKLTQRQKSAES